MKFLKTTIFLTFFFWSWHSFGQEVYFTFGDADLNIANAENTILNGDERFRDVMLAFITKTQNYERANVPDSVFVDFTIDEDGKFEHVKYTWGILNRHILETIEQLKNLTFTQTGIAKLALFFDETTNPEDYLNMWMFDDPPKILDCISVDSTNKTFQKACFNYMIEQQMNAVHGPASSELPEKEGTITAAIMVNKTGKVEQILFGPECFNPKLNDAFANEMALTLFPEGGFENGEQMGYVIPYEHNFMEVDKSKLKDYLKDGQNLFDLGDYYRAIFMTKKALAAGHKAESEQQKLIGDAYFLTGDTAQAKTWWRMLWKYEERKNKEIVPTLIDGQVELRLQDYQKKITTGDGNDTQSFAVVESKPVFPGCEDEESEDARFQCFNTGIMKHIAHSFRFPEAARQNGIQGRIYISFVIEKDGAISNVYVPRGVHQTLDLEGMRVICDLPQMIPAQQRGKPVRMQYTVPINAKLQGGSSSKKKKSNRKKKK